MSLLADSLNTITPAHTKNLLADRQALYSDRLRTILSHSESRRAREEISVWPQYAETPLLRLKNLAKIIGIDEIYYKDEGPRFGLKSFKALGGAYAISKLLRSHIQRHIGALPSSQELLAGTFRDLTRPVTVCCATDGNHGRSVAWGASLFGCSAVIYIHERVSEARASAIAALGAKVVRCRGTYDDSVKKVAADAAINDWVVVSDTSYEGYSDIPRDIMQGYSIIVEEVLAKLPHNQLLTHTFVQAGVGGFAAAVCGYLWETYGAERPRFVVVEPAAAACIFVSIAAGRCTSFGGNLDTIMAGLACGEPSLIAWEILARGVDDALTITDAQAAECIRRLAQGSGGDPTVVAGESAVAGIAGLIESARDQQLRAKLSLNEKSRVLVFGTEADTDPIAYQHILDGRSAIS